MSNLGFVDESGDREHFTIIPNYIANHSTANDQALYLQMKKHAGEGGECFVSNKTLMKKLGIGHKSLKKSIKYLTDHKWIYEKGYRIVNTAGGEQTVQVYGINNIWKLNSDFYHKGGAESAPLSSRVSQKTSKGVLKVTKGGAESAPNKIPMNKIQEEEILEKIRKQVKAKLRG